jgi:hypothetical protein
MLVPDPIFVLSSVRSGSTLLRCLLNAHPDIHAPHELHFGDLKVTSTTRYSDLTLDAMGLTCADLQVLLWDRLLHEQRTAGGKPRIADKTPGNVFNWRHLAGTWPDAQFVVLMRDPRQILRSALEHDPTRPRTKTEEIVEDYLGAVDDARRNLDCPQIRYDDLTADPETTLRGICAYLGVSWDPRMLQYTAEDPGPLLHGIGDTGQRIHSGTVLPARREPVTDVPAFVEAMAANWGY